MYIIDKISLYPIWVEGQILVIQNTIICNLDKLIKPIFYILERVMVIPLYDVQIELVGIIINTKDMIILDIPIYILLIVIEVGIIRIKFSLFEIYSISLFKCLFSILIILVYNMAICRIQKLFKLFRFVNSLKSPFHRKCIHTFNTIFKFWI